ncbi:hypothetical protein MRX96_010284 [Rhipicephalus microplus]
MMRTLQTKAAATRIPQHRRFWTRILHQSYDDQPLFRSAEAKGSTAWIGEGTTFLKGKEYVDLVKFHIAAIPNFTHLKRGQNVSKKCRAGCDADESLRHILQRCHHAHHQRIARHDCILQYLAERLREKEWHVREEPHYRTSQGNRIPDLVLSRDGQCLGVGRPGGWVIGWICQRLMKQKEGST